MRHGLPRNIEADYGKITGFKFQDVWTAIQRDGARTTGVRIRAESS